MIRELAKQPEGVQSNCSPQNSLQASNTV